MPWTDLTILTDKNRYLCNLITQNPQIYDQRLIRGIELYLRKNQERTKEYKTGPFHWGFSLHEKYNVIFKLLHYLISNPTVRINSLDNLNAIVPTIMPAQEYNALKNGSLNQELQSAFSLSSHREPLIYSQAPPADGLSSLAKSFGSIPEVGDSFDPRLIRGRLSQESRASGAGAGAVPNSEILTLGKMIFSEDGKRHERTFFVVQGYSFTYAFYKSSGLNSKVPGTVFPYFGHLTSNVQFGTKIFSIGHILKPNQFFNNRESGEFCKSHHILSYQLPCPSGAEECNFALIPPSYRALFSERIFNLETLLISFKIGGGMWESDPILKTNIQTQFAEKLHRLSNYRLLEGTHPLTIRSEDRQEETLRWARRMNTQLELRNAILMPRLNEPNLQSYINH